MDIKQIEINGEVFPVEDSEARNSITAMNTTIAEQAQTIAQLQKIGLEVIRIPLNFDKTLTANLYYIKIGKLVFFQMYMNIQMQSSANEAIIAAAGNMPEPNTQLGLIEPVFYFPTNYPVQGGDTCIITIKNDGSITMTKSKEHFTCTASGFYLSK